MPPLLQSVSAAVTEIRSRCQLRPYLGIILGSGLGDLIQELQIEARIRYAEIPGFLVSTAMGHAGELVLGKLDDVPLAVLRGRSHLYEGHSRRQITFPIRVLRELGIGQLLLSCAAGGLNPRLDAGDLLLIADTIDLLSRHSPVAGDTSRAASPLAVRQSPRRAKTDPQMNQALLASALRESIPLPSGTYIAVTGPNYETRAEQRFLRMLGDAVGMSTIPEIEAAVEMGLPVAATAMITNVCTPDAPAHTTGEEVLQVASAFLPKFNALVKRYVMLTRQK